MRLNLSTTLALICIIVSDGVMFMTTPERPSAPAATCASRKGMALGQGPRQHGRACE